MKLEDILKKHDIPNDQKHRDLIKTWRSWWRGFNEDFHEYIVPTPDGMTQKLTRSSLKMGKKVCEDWASRLVNERTQITAENQSAQPLLDKLLKNTSFWVTANQAIEQAFATGAVGLVARDESIEFVQADCIYPISYRHNQITECAFVSVQPNDDYYLEIHRTGKIENYLYDKNGNRKPLPDNVADVVKTNVQLFTVITPNVANNVDKSPLGISIFANGIDTLKAVDLAFDNQQNDILLGRKKIMIPQNMLVTDHNGKIAVGKTVEQSLFHAVETDLGGKTEMKEFNPVLRVQENQQALQAALNLLSFKCGLGKRFYNFEESGIITATEVKSSNRELTENTEKQQTMIWVKLETFFQNWLEFQGVQSLVTVTAGQDLFTVAENKQEFLQEIRDGIRQAWEYRVEFLGESVKVAKAMTYANDRNFIE